MRFFYADPGLLNNVGHHPNACRHIALAARANGVPTVVLGHAGIEASLRDELDVVPFFRTFTYFENDGDPICGWLNAFTGTSRDTAQDLGEITDIGSDDVLFLNSARPAQLMALGTWLSTFRIGQAPTVVTEFATEPGVMMRSDTEGMEFAFPDVMADARPFLYRFAATQNRERGVAIHMATYEKTVSAIYTALLDDTVDVLPWPQKSLGQTHSRVGKRPLTLSVLGHQRSDKGYQLLPNIVPAILAHNPDVTFLAHNGYVSAMPEVQAQMRNIAASNPRLVLDERAADQAIWRDLLEASDLIVCPYDPIRYSSSHSTVLSEAIAQGIPVVVPAETVLSRFVDEYAGCGTAFTIPTPAGIADAIQSAIDNFDTLAARADLAASLWARQNGPAQCLDAILSYGNR